MLVLFAAFAVAAAVAPACPGLPALSTVLVACDVPDLDSLYASEVLGLSAPGLCAPACGLALTAMLDPIAACHNDAAVDSLLGVTGAVATLQAAAAANRACDAPFIGCLAVARALATWERTTTGAACRASFAALWNNGNSGTVQSVSQTQCTAASCGGAMTYLLNAFDSRGCADWALARRAKLDYGSDCLAVDGTYCRAVFDVTTRSAAALALVRNASAPLAQREAALPNLCTPCFYAQLRHTALYSDAADLTPSVWALETLCVKAGATWCYPHYATAAAAGGGTQRQSSLKCAGGHRLCAPAVLLRESQLAGGAPALTTQQRRDVDTLCLADPVSGSLCADVTAALVAPLAPSAGPAYALPVQCANVTAGAACPYGCQRRFDLARLQFGCCYEAARSYYTASGYGGVAGAWAAADVVATECSKRPESGCITFNTTEDEYSTATITVNVPMDFIKTNTAAIRTALTADVARMLGRSTSGFSIPSSDTLDDDVTEASSSAAYVTIRVLGQTAADRADVLSVLAANQARQAAVAYNTERLYALRCRDDTGAACSAAAGGPRSLLALVALVALVALALPFVIA